MEKEFSTYIQSPLGNIEIAGTAEYVTRVNFTTSALIETSDASGAVADCKKELQEYFAGKRKKFSVKTAPPGTPFQRMVWNELIGIGFGETLSYTDIANKLKKPLAVRAVGLANGKNPVAIIIPCHRVIGENGKLTGYAGGLWRKQWLLEHEGNVSGKQPTLF